MIKCEEDDDFVAMFDKMMTTDFIEAKGSRGAASNQQIDIVTPGSVRMIKKQPGKGVSENHVVILSVHARGSLCTHLANVHCAGIT